MTPLAPLSGGKNPHVPSVTAATSALAAYATTREKNGSSASPMVRPLSPATGAVAALKPLPKSLGISSGVQPLGSLALAPMPLGEVSALAAFAKKALPPTMGITPLDDLASAKNAKRPKPLRPKRDTQADTKEIKDAESDLVNAEEKKDHQDAEQCLEQKEVVADRTTPSDQSGADVKSTPGGEKEVHNEKKTGETSDSDSGDSIAEFECMESDDDADQIEPREAPIDDLYDHADREEDEHDCQRAKQRMFVPATSTQDLFHAILVRDMELVTHTLSLLSPQDALGIRDAENRTMYHYAAMSRSPEVQAVVFDFINCYLKQDTDQQIGAIQVKQQRLRGDSTKSSGWIPPSIREIRELAERETTEAYLVALRTYDHNGRSFLHYSALNHHLSPVHVSRVLATMLTSHHSELLHKDAFEQDALAYALIADNLLAIRLWFTQLKLGESLTPSDIDRLSQLKTSAQTQRLLLRLLEGCDAKRSPRKHGSKPQTLGLSIQFETKCSTKSSSISSGSSGIRMWYSLHKAAIYGNADAVQHFIAQGTSVKERDSDGWTPLHHCASLGSAAHVKIADMLLDSGADLNASSLHGRTPLHLAAILPSDEALQSFSTAELVETAPSERVQLAILLCQRGAQLEVYDHDHCTPFLGAVRTGNIDVARLLLESNCDALALDKTDGCALHIAVCRGLEEMVRFLCWWDASQGLAWRFAKDCRGRLPLVLARADSPIRLCLENLWYGVRLGDLEHVRKQLEQHQAIRGKHERARLISVHDKTPHTRRTALHLAIEPFVEMKKPTTATSTVPTTRHSIQNAKIIVVALLQADASLAAKDAWGITPLMLAACIESPMIVEAMLAFATEEELNQADAAGNRAIHYSYAFSRAKTSSLIEDAMDDADMENFDSRRPLTVTGFRDKLFPNEYRAYLASRGGKPKAVVALTTSRRK